MTAGAGSAGLGCSSDEAGDETTPGAGAGGGGDGGQNQGGAGTAQGGAGSGQAGGEQAGAGGTEQGGAGQAGAAGGEQAGSGGTAGTGGSGGSGGSGGGTAGSAGDSAGGGAGAAGKGQTTPPGTAIGKPSDFPDMTVYMITKAKVLLGHDAGGYYALSSICTHSACDMSKPATGEVLGNNDIVCHCHGSLFSPTGAVLQGPAQKALAAYALALGDDGILYVDKATKASASTRLAV